MSNKTRGNVNKERIVTICRRVNNGEKPSIAINAEGLGGTYLTALKKSGIIFKDPITGRWQGLMRIHDDRFEKFVSIRKEYTKVSTLSAKTRREASKKEIKNSRAYKKQTPKVGMFRKIWNSIFG